MPPEGSRFLDFVRSVRGEGPGLVSAEDSFLITEACLSARRSADKGLVVPIPAPET